LQCTATTRVTSRTSFDSIFSAIGIAPIFVGRAGWFSKNIGYGYVYGANHVLSQVETSYAIVAGLIAMDTPLQSAWHLQNCINGGATIEEARAVRSIAMEVAARCGVVWENDVPDVGGEEKSVGAQKG